MKDRTGKVLQYSGYPLKIATAKVASMTVVRQEHTQKISPKKKSIADDPRYWDVAWFSSYE